MDGGTLYQLRNIVNRRNVGQYCSKNVNACEDFFTTVTEAHILAAAMEVFQMDSLEDRPSTDHFLNNSSHLDSLQRRQLILLGVKEVLAKFVNLPSVTETPCKKDRPADGVFDYACSTLSFGLLYQEYMDSVREGDGNRIFRVWRYLPLVFRAAGRTNYVLEAFNLLAQEKFLLSARLAKQLRWSRIINTSGLPGKNIPCDLHMEHLNCEYKTSLCGLGSNITDHSVQIIGKCLGKTTKMMQHFDEISGITPQSGSHDRRSSKGDLDRVLNQLKENLKYSEFMRVKSTVISRSLPQLSRVTKLHSLN